MSRIGKRLLVIPNGVKVNLFERELLVEGPKGKIKIEIHPLLKIEKTDKEIKIICNNFQDKFLKSIYGTTNALIKNALKGVTEGYKKELDVVGTGFKAQVKQQNILNLVLSFSHPVNINIPSDLKVSTPNPNRIIIEGVDKQKVNKFASEVRSIYKPEPYQGKGIRYVGEFVRKKLGKALAK